MSGSRLRRPWSLLYAPGMCGGRGVRSRVSRFRSIPRWAAVCDYSEGECIATPTRMQRGISVEQKNKRVKETEFHWVAKANPMVNTANISKHVSSVCDDAEQHERLVVVL
jgi:hypothetical protein